MRKASSRLRGTALALLLAACASPLGSAATEAPLARAATPTFFMPATRTTAPTATITPLPTHAETFTPPPPATATWPPLDAPTPTRTRRPASGGTAPATAAPSVTHGAAWYSTVGGGHGVTAQLFLYYPTTVYGHRVDYLAKLKNTTGAPVNYGVWGVGATSLDGTRTTFGTAWSGAGVESGFLELAPGPFNWNTYIAIPDAGEYEIVISMCFSRYGDCLGGTGDWEELSGRIRITVK